MTQTLNGAVLDDEAEYQAWLRDPTARVCHLVEMTFGPRSTYSAPGESTTVLLSDCLFPGALPAVMEIPSLRREISGVRVSQSAGSLVLSNRLGVAPFDGTLFRKNIDGRPVRIYHGEPSWPRERFRRIFDGVAGAVLECSVGRIRIAIAYRDLLANQVVSTATVASGPNAGRTIPMTYGTVQNVTPLLVDSATSTYQIHDGQINQVGQVRDSGLPFVSDQVEIASVDVGANTITFTEPHGWVEDTRVRFSGFGPTPPTPISSGTDYWVIASGLTTDACKLSATRGGTEIDLTTADIGALAYGYYWSADLAAGTIALATVPAGQITLDAQGHVGADGYADDLCSIAEAIVGSGMVDQRRRRAFLASASGFVMEANGVFVADRANKLDVLDALFGGIDGWYGWSRHGALMFGRLLFESPDVWYITEDDLLGDISAGEYGLPLTEVRVRYWRNYTDQTSGLASGITEDARAWYSKPGLVATFDIESATPTENTYLIERYKPPLAVHPVDHVQAYQSPEIDWSGRYWEGAVELAEQIAMTHATWRVPVTFQLGRIGQAMEIGDTLYARLEWLGTTGEWARGSIDMIEDRPSEGTTTVRAVFLVPHDNG